MAEDGKPFPFLATPADEAGAAFSPDGRFLAYDSDESGTREVFVQRFPANGAKWQASITGGSGAAWRADGKELFYVSSDGRLMAVAIAISGSGLNVGAPRALFATQVVTAISTGRQYDVAPDGRFLLNEPVGSEASSPIVVIVPGSERSR
jgi:Tol biopolymer transport system component